MLRAIIIDDEPLACDVLLGYLRNHSSIKVVGVFSNAIDSIKFLKRQQVDIMFLDIGMPELSGLDFLKKLVSPPLSIITTASPNHALEGFDLNVVDYLLKPFSESRFQISLTKAKDLFNLKRRVSSDSESGQRDFITVNSGYKLLKLPLDEIYLVEAFSDYVRIYLADNIVVTLQTLKSTLNKLPEDRFILAHRSYIVQLNKIQQYVRDELDMGIMKVPVGRSYKRNVLNRLSQLGM